VKRGPDPKEGRGRGGAWGAMDGKLDGKYHGVPIVSEDPTRGADGDGDALDSPAAPLPRPASSSPLRRPSIPESKHSPGAHSLRFPSPTTRGARRSMIVIQ